MSNLTNAIDYFVAKIQPLGIKGYEILVNQIPVEILKTKMWLWLLGIVTGICLGSMIFFIKKVMDYDDYIPGVVIFLVLFILFGVGFYSQIIDLIQLNINPEYYIFKNLIINQIKN